VKQVLCVVGRNGSVVWCPPVGTVVVTGGWVVWARQWEPRRVAVGNHNGGGAVVCGPVVNPKGSSVAEWGRTNVVAVQGRPKWDPTVIWEYNKPVRWGGVGKGQVVKWWGTKLKRKGKNQEDPGRNGEEVLGQVVVHGGVGNMRKPVGGRVGVRKCYGRDSYRCGRRRNVQVAMCA